MPFLLSLAPLPPPLDLRQLAAFQFDPVPCALVLAAAAGYVWGVVRVNRLQPRHRWSPWRTTFFLLGLVVVLGSIETFVGVYDSALFWDHMVQHLALIMLGSGLLALGAPFLLAWRATTGEAHDLVTRGLRSPVARFFDQPLVAFAIYAVVIPLTHLTVFYNYTLVNQTVHNLEHLLYVVVGYLFWRQVVGFEPSEHRMHPGLRLGYLALAVPVDTFTGLTLSLERHEIFPAYIAMHRTWGPSLISDLHIGGTIMWVGGDGLMLLAMIPVAVAWVRYEDRRAQRIDRELDALEPDDDGPSQGGGATPRTGWRAFLPHVEAQ